MDEAYLVVVVVDELDVLDPASLLGAPDVAEDSDELLAGGVVGAVELLRVVESVRVVDSVRVPGEADGATRSRSVTRSVLSVQPASTPVPSASTQKPVSNLFIVVPPSWIRSAVNGCNGSAASARLGVRWAAGGRLQEAAQTLKENSQ